MRCSRLLLLYLLWFQNVTDGTQVEKELLEIDFSMAALSSLLIEENSEELERTMQAASRQPLQHIPTNQVQCQEAAPEAAVAQVCSARD
jgi:hypothetical protein